MAAEARSVRTARHFVSALVGVWGVEEECLDALTLVVGELAANAAQHGGTDVSISVSLDRRELRLEVADSGSPRPSSSRTAADECGRGLDIVEHLADWTETVKQGHLRCVRAGFHVRSARTTPQVRPSRPAREYAA